MKFGGLLLFFDIGDQLVFEIPLSKTCLSAPQALNSDTEVPSECWCQGLSHVSEILCASYPRGWSIPGWDVCPVRAVWGGHNQATGDASFQELHCVTSLGFWNICIYPTFHTCMARSFTTRCLTPWYLISFCCPTKTSTKIFCVCDQPGSPNQSSRDKPFTTS